MEGKERPGRRLLVIDHERTSSTLIAAVFAACGFEVLRATDGPSGVERAQVDQPDLLVLDLELPIADGFHVLERLRHNQPSVPIVVLTACTDLRTVVRAMQLGATDYLIKPSSEDELVRVVQEALEGSTASRDLKIARNGALGLEMGPSEMVRRIEEQVETVARSSFSVLILGETGSGKEVVAQAIHRSSDRWKRTLYAIDCGAIPEPLLESELFGHEKGAFTGALRRKEGLFTLAKGGTLFLDEIGNIPLGLQAKLLRVLESKRVQPVGATKTIAIDVRFVAATNEDLRARVAEGSFRADLYFRLAQYTMSLPPLRNRAGDIPYLAQRFLEEVSRELRRPMRTLSTEVLSLLAQHRWPGNVRELRNVVRQAALEARDTIEPAAIERLIARGVEDESEAVSFSGGRSLRELAEEAARDAERRAISDTLKVTGGNKAEAARTLRTDYKTLHVKMKQLGIRAQDFFS